MSNLQCSYSNEINIYYIDRKEIEHVNIIPIDISHYHPLHYIPKIMCESLSILQQSYNYMQVHLSSKILKHPNLIRIIDFSHNRTIVRIIPSEL